MMIALVALLVASVLPMQGQRIVKGLVVDAEGTPLPGVSVLVTGKTASGTSTTIDGKYAVNAESSDTLSWVERAYRLFLTGEGDVDDVVFKVVRQLFFFYLFCLLFEQRLCFFTDFVGERADDRALFCAERTHRAEYRRDLAFLAQEPDADIFNLCSDVSFFYFFFYVFQNIYELVFHSQRNFPSVLILFKLRPVK